MNKLQELMYNEGERLVPYVSHDQNELVRHRSSYAFFHRVIQADIQSGRCGAPDEETSIVDLGFGTGFGCAMLASLPGAKIVGVDIGPECETYGRQYYERRNIDYLIGDLTTYIPSMPTFDYAVSRGVLEHVPDGLNLIGQIKFANRALIDVPFDEQPGNPHHVAVGIREEAFAHLANCEFFYEDLEGNIYDAARKPEKPNLIMVVLSAPGLPKVSDQFEFPIAAVRDDDLERASSGQIGGKRYDTSKDQLLNEAVRAIRETDTVADIGCGILPMNYFRPKLHLMVEPWKEYSDVLSYRYRDDKSVLVLRCGALEALRALGDRSIDSIFLLDVIEHLEKQDGHEVLVECERVAREQIVLFTPLGFMPQHMDTRDKDGWGLSGTDVQQHRSGWTPDDFGPNWSFYVCQDFHEVDFRNDPLDKHHGAFFAIRSFDPTEGVPVPDTFTELRRPLPSELEAVRLTQERDAIDAKYHEILSLRGVQFYLSLRRRLKSLTSS